MRQVYRVINRYLQSRPPHSTMSRLTPFEDAMKSLYGDLDTPDIQSWSPPTKPGSGGHRGRYLWTDGFGVLNFLTLYREKNDSRYLSFAERLVVTVHDVLGRTRDGSSRLPGASDQNPLGGGLRIGKEEASGSDGDGQYHHCMSSYRLHCLMSSTAVPISYVTRYLAFAD